MKTFFRRVLLGLLLIVLLALLALLFWPEAKYEPHEPSDEYLKRSAAYLVPDLPPDWTYHMHEAEDGLKVRWGETGNRAGGRATVLFIPGYTSTLDIHGDHIYGLASRGYHVVGIDLRGQGGSERHRESHPEKLWAENFGVYSDDVAEIIRAKNFGTDRPLILLGSSFGGHAALRAAADHDVPIAGMVLLAPAYAPNTAPYTLAQTKRLGKIAVSIGRSEEYAPGQGNWKPDSQDLTLPSDCASYPPRLYMRDAIFVRHPEQRVGGVTNQWVYGMITSGEYLREDEVEAKIDMPITMIAAERDVIIDSKVSEDACTDGLPNCTLKIYPDTGHCLTLENDDVLTKIYDDVDEIFEQITAQ